MTQCTTDFDIWLNACGPHNSTEARCIEKAILNIGEKYGPYVVEEQGGLCFLCLSDNPISLCFVCADAVDLFLERLRAPYKFDLDTQQWMDMERAIEII